MIRERVAWMAARGLLRLLRPVTALALAAAAAPVTLVAVACAATVSREFPSAYREKLHPAR